MGNCCASSGGSKAKKNKKPNPFAGNYTVNHRSDTTTKLHVLKDPTGRDIDARYELGRELGRGEFGITYMATDLETGDKFACKSISKKKLRTAVDIEDVRREVEIMKHLPKHANIVTLRDTFEDDSAVHIVMELCEGGELFDRIVARGHYTERAAAAVVKTIVDVVQKRCFLYPLGLLNLLYIRQMCHRHGVRPSAARPASDSGELHTPARQLLRRGMTRRDLRRTNPRRATTREGIYKCLNWGRWGTPCGVPPLLLLDEEEVLHMRHNGRHVAINLWEFIVR